MAEHRLVMPDNEGSNPSGHTTPKESALSGATAHTRKNVTRTKTKNAPYLSSAQRAAIEKALAPYMTLTCGHMVARETAVLFSVFAPNIKDVFCERCDEYMPLKKIKRTDPYPANPLF